MKKFLSMLLALSVVFTYTFGAAGSVFATSTQDVLTQLEKTKADYTEYMETAAKGAIAQIKTDVNNYPKDTDETSETYGMYSIGNGTTNYYYTVEGFEAAAKEIIKKYVAAIDLRISGDDLDSYDPTIVTNAVLTTDDTTDPEDVVTVATAATVAGMVKLLTVGDDSDDDAENSGLLSVTDAEQLKLNKVTYLAAIDGVKLEDYATKADVYPLADITASTYNVVATEKTLTAQEYVDLVKKGYTKYINDQSTAKSLTVASLDTAYGGFWVALSDTYVKTVKEEAKDVTNAGDANASVKTTYQTAALSYYNTNKVAKGSNVASKIALSGVFEENWDAGAKKLFGVEIANTASLTEAEAAAVNTAMKKAVDNSIAVYNAYVDTCTAAGNNSPATVTGDVGAFLKKAADIDQNYADAVAIANMYKNEYIQGVKTYDDSKIDKYMEYVKAYVYDLSKTLVAKASMIAATTGTNAKEAGAGNATCYFDQDARASFIGDATGLVAFNNYVTAAVEKIFVVNYDGTTLTTGNVGTYAQTKENATYKAKYEEYPEEVYLLGSYDNDSATVKAKWVKIANDAYDAITAAQSYAEVDKALAEAKAAFQKLEPQDKGGNDVVADAILNYTSIFNGYAEVKAAELGSDYTAVCAATKTAGQTMIAKAVSVAEAKQLEVKAEALYNNVKTDKEVEPLEEAMNAKIKALPASVTIANYDEVLAVAKEYVDYCDINGTTKAITYKAILKSKVDTVRQAKKDALDKEVSDMIDALNAVKYNNDTALAAYLAKEADVNAIVDAIEAFDDDDDLLTDAAYTIATSKSITTTVGGVDITNINFSAKRVALTENILAKAAKSGDEADITAAMDAYKALSEKEQLTVAFNAPTVLEAVQSKAEAIEKENEELKKAEAEKEALKTTIAVKDSKTKFASSKAYKNSIKLTFNKPAVGVDGYVVYMATKKNGLYKKVATVKTNTYTKKSLKKGTSYYFKVKAYKVVDGKKVYTQTSGKLCKKTTK